MEIWAQRVYAHTIVGMAPIPPRKIIYPIHTLTKWPQNWIFLSLISLLLCEAGWLNIGGSNPCHCHLQSYEKKLAMKLTMRQ